MILVSTRDRHRDYPRTKRVYLVWDAYRPTAGPTIQSLRFATLLVAMYSVLVYVLAFHFFNVLSFNGFQLYGGHHLRSLLGRRTTRPHQCVLVQPSPGLSVPESPGTPGDQSPLLPGPSRGSPGTIQAQSACGKIGATGSYVWPEKISLAVDEGSSQRPLARFPAQMVPALG